MITSHGGFASIQALGPKTEPYWSIICAFYYPRYFIVNILKHSEKAASGESMADKRCSPGVSFLFTLPLREETRCWRTWWRSMSYFVTSSELGGQGPHPPWKPMACSVKSLHSCHLTDPFCHPPRRQSTTFPLCRWGNLSSDTVTCLGDLWLVTELGSALRCPDFFWNFHGPHPCLSLLTPTETSWKQR